MTNSKPVATSKAAIPSPFPEGFVSPFKRVEMSPNVRIDDGLACVAMLTNQPLEAIKQLAYKFGLAPHGPAWVYASLLRKLINHFDLVASEDLEINSIDALPAVALITSHFNPDTQYGRWVLWHHVRGDEKIKSFNYVIDPAYWIDEKLKVTNDFKQLLTPKQPIYYIEITPKPAAKGK